VVRIERRTIPGETEAGVMAEIEALLDELRREDASFVAEARAFFVREPFEVGRDAPIVEALDAAATRTLGRPPEHMGDTPWMDSALLAAQGIDTVVFGPHGAGAHADEEWVDVESVVQTAEILIRTAQTWCV
jgi:acetylornithine deacetylase